MDYIKAREEYKRQLAIYGVKLVHYAISVGLFFIFWLLFRYGTLLPSREMGFRYNLYIVLGYGVILFFFNRTYNSYLLGYSKIRELVFAESLSQMLALTAIYVLASLGWDKWHNPTVFIGVLLIQLILNAIWAHTANEYYFKIYPPKKSILIYRNKLDKHRFGTVQGKPSERLYKIEKELMFDGKFSELKDKLKGYDAIFVAGLNSRCRNGILKYCKEESIPGFFLPHIGDVIMQEAMHIQAFDSPVMFITRSVTKPEYGIVKRVFDICASLLGIVILSPIMGLVALAIKLYDGGPAFYKQVRLTKDGKEFKIWKFRSMRVDAEKDGIARLSTGDKDDRITPIGRVVRKCRFDELPQMFNVLMGDMSIVGPRPERPEIAEQYYKTLPDFKLRLQVKAGITGYAQVYGKYNTDPYEKLEFDLLYIRNMGMLTDLKLIFATFSVLFNSESTTGVAGTTAMDYEESDQEQE